MVLPCCDVHVHLAKGQGECFESHPGASVFRGRAQVCNPRASNIQDPGHRSPQEDGNSLRQGKRTCEMFDPVHRNDSAVFQLTGELHDRGLSGRKARQRQSAKRPLHRPCPFCFLRPCSPASIDRRTFSYIRCLGVPSACDWVSPSSVGPRSRLPSGHLSRTAGAPPRFPPLSLTDLIVFSAGRFSLPPFHFSTTSARHAVRRDRPLRR